MRLPVIWRRLACISAVALLTACTLDGVPSAPQTETAEPMELTIPLNETHRSEVTRTGSCDVRTTERDAGGKFLRRGQVRRQTFALRTRSQDSLVSGYGALRFDELGRQSHEAFCRLPRGPAALALLGRIFDEQIGDQSESPAPGIAYNIAFGTMCYWADDDPDSINYDVICGGTYCSLLPGGAHVSGTPSSASRLRAEVPIGPHSAAAAVWDCGGGSGISLGFDGIFTYHDPGSGLPDSPTSGGGGETCSEPPGDGDDPKSPPEDQLRAAVVDCPDALPAGWPREIWDRLTVGEKALVLTNPLKWTVWRYIGMSSMKTEAEIESLLAVLKDPRDRRCDDGEQNAFQHAIWSAALARRYGPDDARAWTEAHEDLGRQLTPAEYASRQMDIQNNELGISAAFGSGPNGTARQDVQLRSAELFWISNEPCLNTPP